MHTQFFVGKPEEKRTLGRYRHRWENNIKVDYNLLVLDNSFSQHAV
jgi:hypothetical protein